MATQRVPVLQFPSQHSHKQSRKQLPETFEQALSAGWVIVSEATSLSPNQKTRRGTILLSSKGQSKIISVPYTATKNGFVFGAPQLTQ